jgi:hypothetical protein
MQRHAVQRNRFQCSLGRQRARPPPATLRSCDDHELSSGLQFSFNLRRELEKFHTAAQVLPGHSGGALMSLNHNGFSLVSPCVVGMLVQHTVVSDGEAGASFLPHFNCRLVLFPALFSSVSELTCTELESSTLSHTPCCQRAVALAAAYPAASERRRHSSRRNRCAQQRICNAQVFLQYLCPCIPQFFPQDR